MDYIKDLVSVVIPTHNREKLLCRALESALKQTYRNIEVIVVSDGSEDNTDDVMKTYMSQYDGLKYIAYSPARGGNYARNTGIKSAKGEYVAFLDDDDEWHEDKIQKQIEMIVNDPELGLICTAMNSIDDASGRCSVFTPNAQRDSSVGILKSNLIGSTTTVLVRHELLDAVDYFDENLKAMQDYDLWIRLCQITKVGVVTTPCVEYHNLVSNKQISWDYEKYVSSSDYIFEKYKELRSSKLTQEEIKGILVRNYLNVSRKALKSENRKAVREYAGKAFKTKPNVSSVVYYIASVFSVNAVKKIRHFLKNK